MQVDKQTSVKCSAVLNSSESIHPFEESSYVFPSPIVTSGCKVLRSRMTVGGTQKPPALTQATMYYSQLRFIT